jgi:adenylate cyclase
MVAFPSAVEATSCAIEIQQAVHRHNARLGDDRLQVRVGLNVGEPIRDEDDYFGTAVVVAKRLCDEAAGGQILLSQRAYAALEGKVDAKPIARLELKGLARPVNAYELIDLVG